MLELVQVQPEIKEKILDIRGEQEGRDRLSKHRSLTGQLYACPGETRQSPEQVKPGEMEALNVSLSKKQTDWDKTHR